MQPQHPSWDISLVTPPWGSRPSIYQHLLAYLSPGIGLLEGGDKLPDDKLVYPKGRLRWVAGAPDVLIAHPSPDATMMEEMYTAIHALTEESTDERAAVLYEISVSHTTMDYIDPFIRQVAERRELSPDRMHAIAHWLTTEAADREVVKFGLAFLGLFYTQDDLPLLLTLGRHEEFTMYVAVALCNGMKQPDKFLWELAKQVTGWGRINIVERLKDTQDAEIKAWLLREGYQNSIMNEYTALTCAIGGGLLATLQEPDPDDALLFGAGKIIDALLNGTPGPGMKAYVDGVTATELYLTHLLTRKSELMHFLIVLNIDYSLNHLDEIAGITELGWYDRREALRELIQAYVNRPDWLPLIHEGLAVSDRDHFLEAARSAERMNIDTWEAFFSRLLVKDDSYFWSTVSHTDDFSRFNRLIELAMQRLPLEEMATGPTLNIHFFEPAGKPYRILDTILIRLKNLPGMGWPFLRAGLRCPIIRTRKTAVSVLAAWGRAFWPQEAETCLQAALAIEPEEQTRKLLRKVLAGEPLE
ncbi:MAG: hypothetical protein ACYDBB_19005 [Armatimonadota bacterium]